MAFLLEALPVLSVLVHLLDSIGDGVRASRINEAGGVASDFGHRPPVRRDDRRFRTHRFENRKAKPLVQRWEEERQRVLVEPSQFRVGYEPESVNVLDGRYVGRGEHVPFRSDEYEL